MMSLWRRPVHARPLAASLVVLVTAGCATSGPPPQEPLPDACDLLPHTAEGPDRVSVALAEGVDPGHALAPRNASERMVFAHLYETLVRVDCEGRVLPGLAESWSAAEDGRQWTFTLREDAYFWDGSRATAFDVEESWQRAREISGIELPVLSARVLSERGLSVTFNSPHLGMPAALADPALALAGPVTSSGWPPGTGPYRIVEAGQEGILRLQATGSGSELRPQIIEFRVAADTDLRDQLDQNVHLLVTGDPSVLEYAELRSDSLPLPWLRTLVLVAPGGNGLPESPGLTGAIGEGVLSASTREALARDAVRGEARGADGPFWWQEVAGCEVSLATEPRAFVPPRGDRIVYPEVDREAGEVAERLVALADTRGLPPGAGTVISPLMRRAAGEGVARLQAAGLPREEFEQALRFDQKVAFVLSLPRRVLDPCRQIRALVERLGWLATALGVEGPLPAAELELDRLLMPLVALRRRAVFGRQLFSVRIEWDGTPLLFASEWRAR